MCILKVQIPLDTQIELLLLIDKFMFFLINLAESCH